MGTPPSGLTKKLPDQLFFWTGEDAESISKQLCVLENTLQKDNNLSLYNLARALYLENSNKQPLNPCPINLGRRENKFGPGQETNKVITLVIVANSLDDLKNKIASAEESLKNGNGIIRDSKGIYFSSEPLTKNNGKIAFLFSGQGSQRPNMLKELTVLFPEMQESIQKADAVLKNRFPKLLSEYIYPPLPATPEEEQSQMAELTQTNIAQPALGAIEVGLLKVMKLFGVNADMLAGHSLGEYVALYAAGVLGEEKLYELLEYRGSAIVNSSKDGNLGSLPARLLQSGQATDRQAGMLAVGANAKEIEGIIKGLADIYIANLNSPKQTILSGSEEALDLASVKLQEKGLKSKKINVSCAFHSPYMSPAKDLLFKKLASMDYKMPAVSVYSNLTAARYPEDKKNILSILSDHLISPVRFTEEIENMFEDGARVFIEVGPGNVLTNLVKQILGEKEYVAIACNIKTAPDVTQILNVLAQLMAEGFEVDLAPLYPGL